MDRGRQDGTRPADREGYAIMRGLLERARSPLFLLALIVSIGLAFTSCSDEGPTSSGCGDCGSGDVYWDASVERCRDREDGRFVKSCCCGH
jgi:hypothetical protein